MNDYPSIPMATEHDAAYWARRFDHATRQPGAGYMISALQELAAECSQGKADGMNEGQAGAIDDLQHHLKVAATDPHLPAESQAHAVQALDFLFPG